MRKALVPLVALVGVLLLSAPAVAGQVHGMTVTVSSSPGAEPVFPAGAAAASAHRSASPAASQSKKKKCKKGRKHGKRKKCRHGKHRHHPPPALAPAPPAPQAGWRSGRYTGSYSETASVELRFNVVGSRLYTGAFDSFFVEANCSGGTPDPDAIAPVEASIASNGDFSGSGVYSPGLGLQLPWHISGHITGSSITNGSFTVSPYMNTFGETCSGTSHFVAQWFADYTL